MSRHSAISPSPALLAQLRDVKHVGAAYAGGSIALPPPGLRVAGMPHPVAFPLVPPQAAQLRRLASRCDACGAAELHAGDVEFVNQKWHQDMDALVSSVARCMGFTGAGERAWLGRVVVVVPGEGGVCARHLEAHGKGHVQLVVQMPSWGCGGQIRLSLGHGLVEYPREQQSPDVAFKAMYAAYYMDVPLEVTPVTKGCRLMLVYHIRWDERIFSPSGLGRGIYGVQCELSSIARSFPNGSWMLAMSLPQQISDGMLNKRGFNALLLENRRHVETLRCAARVANMGELEVHVCQLERNDIESCSHSVKDDDRASGRTVLEVQRVSLGDVKLRRAYDCGGERSDGAVPVDFCEATGCHLRFERDSVGPIERCDGEHGVFRRVTHSCTAVLIWPKERTAERKLFGRTNMATLLRDVPENGAAEVVSRFLPCLQTLEDSGVNCRKHVEHMLGICMRQHAWEPVAKLLSFATLVDRMPYIEDALHDVVSLFGWERVVDHVRGYLIYHGDAKVTSMHGRIRAVNKLHKWMPAEMLLKHLSMVTTFIEREKGELQNMGSAQYTRSHHCGLWGCVFETVLACEAKSDVGTARNTLADMGSRIEHVLTMLPRPHLEVVHEAFTTKRATSESLVLQGMKGRVNHLLSDLLMSALKDEIACIREQAGHAHSGRRPELIAWKWPSIVGLATTLQCVDVEGDRVEKCLDAFLAAVVEVRGSDPDEMERALASHPLPENFRHVEFKLMDVVGCLKVQARKRKLLEELQRLEESTSVEPERVPVRYQYPGGFGSGIPKLESFMAGNDMKTNVGTFASVAEATEALCRFQHRLPLGTFSCVGGQKPYIFIHITKPYADERERWVKYRADLLALGRLRLNVREESQN